MTDKELFRLTLKAFGAIQEGHDDLETLISQQAAIGQVMSRLDDLQLKIQDKRRVMEAKANQAERIQPGDHHYGVHMRHCYGLSDEPWSKPNERFTCKYGEDDVCPAALFEDPWAEYVRAEKAGEL